VETFCSAARHMCRRLQAFYVRGGQHSSRSVWRHLWAGPQANPFQSLVAVANLSVGVLGILCYWIRGTLGRHSDRGSLLVGGAGAVHIKDIVVSANYAPNNAGANTLHGHSRADSPHGLAGLTTNAQVGMSEIASKPSAVASPELHTITRPQKLTKTGHPMCRRRSRLSGPPKAGPLRTRGRDRFIWHR